MIKDTIKLSPEFKKQTTRAILSILLFLLVYLVIAGITIVITCLCIYGGIMLASLLNFVTIAAGIGLGGMGVLLFIFVFKFIFKSHKTDRSHLVEITREEQPELFAIIQDIVEQVGTDFPRRVYVSAEVNAAVFYDSNFWSMFLPVKKNLQIGLGLVNTITVDELRAILAHEFGHFSQRTMKLGSYVYNVNQVIHNMLFDNESYDNLIRKWSGISGYFFIFVAIAVKMIQGLQWLLARIYAVVNKGYLGLSREMEFHADEVAAHVTGYIPLKESLLRMDLSDHSLNMVFQFYDRHIPDLVKSENVFREQFGVMMFLAKNDGTPFHHHLPQVSLEEANKFNKSKLVIKDQWASHPGNEERIARLETLGIVKDSYDHKPANSIFKQVEKLQEKLTENIFSKVTYTADVKINTFNSFQTAFEKEYIEESFDKIFNGYYEHKNPEKFDLDTPAREYPATDIAGFFSQEQLNLVYTSISLQHDIGILTQIKENKLGIKTFDYDGKKYKKKNIPGLLVDMQEALKNINEEIRTHDLQIYQAALFKEKTAGHENKLRHLYQVLFDYDAVYEKRAEVFNQLSEAMNFVSQQNEIKDIKDHLFKAKGIEERLKVAITELLTEEPYLQDMTAEMKSNFENYLPKPLSYFSLEQYDQHNLNILFTAMNNFYFLASRGYFLRKKALLAYQAELMKPGYTKDVKQEPENIINHG